MKIPFVNLKLQWQLEKNDLLKIIDKIFSKAEFVGGQDIKKFEDNIKKRCNTKYAVALNSGTDALTIGLHLLGVRKGDEVITPPNSFIASTAVIVHLGAIPVFIDVESDQNIDPKKIESAITKKTKAIMAVHLTGRMCDMKALNKISKKYNIPIIEDAAQAIGSTFKNKSAGSFSKIGCFSAHPLKNLNAFGDAGYLVTNDYLIAKNAKSLISHGIENRNTVRNFGYVSRMDNIQAAILNYHLKKIDKVIKLRRANAFIYKKTLDKKNVFFPEDRPDYFDTFHTFVIQGKKRDKLKFYLKKKGIETSIHYPIPIHLQPASKRLKYKKGDFPMTEKQANEILTLPIHQYLTKKEIIYIANQVNNFYKT